jgi:pilus assembly protein FimV
MSMRSRLPLALTLALGSSSALALGLGQIEVKSALNQPLSAEIPVISGISGETDALTVRLAPPEALSRVGLPAPSGVAANLEFALDSNARGQTVIRVTTPSKVNEPFVTFLLEVDWGKGRILREYTVLLDPPMMAPVRRAPVSAPVPVSVPEPEVLADVPPPPALSEPAREPEPAAVFEPVTEPQPEPAPVAQTPPAPPPPAATLPPAPDPAPTRTDTYGPVASGETLWSIAQYARPDESISMNQMMLALLYANPDAFIDQNINKLKRGAILRIPTRDESMAVAAVEAAAQVREQMQSWRAQSAPVMQPAEPRPTSEPAPRPVASRPPAADSRLELVPPRGDAAAAGAQSGASAAGEGRELRAELARSQEQISTLNQENVELKSRVTELEKIGSDSRRLLDLKNSELKAAQDRLAALEARQAEAAAAAAATADASPAVTDAAAPSEPVADVSPEPETASDPTVDTVVAPGPVPVVTSSESAPIEATPEPVAITPPPAVEPAPWYMNLWVLGGGGLVLAVLTRSARFSAETGESSADLPELFSSRVSSPRM